MSKKKVNHKDLSSEADTLAVKKETILINMRNVKYTRDAFITIDHETRKNLLGHIEADELEELTVTQIFIRDRIEQSAASQHLSRLLRFGIVNNRRSGKEIYYSVNFENRSKIEVLACRLYPNSSTPVASSIKLCRALNHKKRLEILEILDDFGGCNVGDIYRSKDWEQSETSRNLKILREAGLISGTRGSENGKQVYYKIEYKELERVVNLINNFAKAAQKETTLATQTVK